MIPLLLLGAGLALTVAGVMLLRSLGPRYRVARLLAAAPAVSLAEAAEIAAGDQPRYVRITGRISSDEEFPDENDRPLVYRRRRLQAAEGAGWRTLTDDREAVPFGLELRSDFVAVDGDALDEGLVVLPREALGSADDLPADVARDMDPSLAVRMVVEQVSAVEHATAAGVPRARDSGPPVLSSGLGRPLVLTTLEVPAAMRVLAGDQRRRVLVAALLLVTGPLLVSLGVVWAMLGG